MENYMHDFIDKKLNSEYAEILDGFEPNHWVELGEHIAETVLEHAGEMARTVGGNTLIAKTNQTVEIHGINLTISVRNDFFVSVFPYHEEAGE